ncbi:MAG: CoB--CoM heterodisulfide reductase iron-sulfur subunit B family protein [Deltaproteobacteria bacterium]|nr:CoB--CoM heterodisulfide reductase iron-sulfur subunit B family protein [Deltaproteobacteria bacterium]
MKFAYYPGCTAKSTSIEYDESVRETSQYLDVGLEEIPDWSCCGASSGHVINHELALALPSRNLALTERMSLDMVTPCPACSLRHKVAEHELKNNLNLKARIETDIGIDLKLSQKTKHILEVFYHDVGIDLIEKKVQKALTNLKAVTYYGCYLVRPPGVTEFDDPENPIIMDKIMEALGVEVIDWSCKVDCCGGGLSLTAPEIVKKLAGKIVMSASESGADAIITACPMCQANLDMRQPDNEDSHPVPIFYFSELTALALGNLRIKEWLEKHMVDPAGLLRRLELL